MLPLFDTGDPAVVFCASACRSLCSFSCRKDDMAEGRVDSELASRDNEGVGRGVIFGDVVGLEQAV